ncbi:putative CRAL-TRIO lipid binding domain-containing protein [Lupinus albus]|uniref:Putative CRAL-TRIO lipid binding domain-containing protein n=1 Tax=Lupinus albus TaxID=3870 RepID=A0A6A4N7M0_LUPAL|nr:putative CRAL-TRIO lipid binding domain-containing protein [Lupinus albus]
MQMVKPLLETKTSNKVKFVYSGDHNTEKILEDLFDMNNLESAFGGENDTLFDVNKYAERMKEDTLFLDTGKYSIICATTKPSFFGFNQVKCRF